jgi:hypothetical protein
MRIGFAVEWLMLAAALVLTLIFHPGPTGTARDTVTSLFAFAMGM